MKLRPRVPYLTTILFLGALSLISSASAQSMEPPEKAAPNFRLKDGQGILSIPISIPRASESDTLEATFDFGFTKGGTPVFNEDKSFIAVTNYPATKTSYVHLFIRHPNGDLTAVNSFNEQAARLLKGRWADAATYRLEAVSMSGRIIQLKVFNYLHGNEAEEHSFKVSVSENGTLKLAQ